MKTRRAFRALSILLIVALLSGLFPAAYAEGKDDVAANQPAPAAKDDAPAEEEAPVTSREETILSFLRLVMKAEAASDPQERAALCREAEVLWNSYLETAPAGSTANAEALEKDGQRLERQDMLYDLMQYIMAAETESDPAVRASLYLQADAIWYSYLGLINSAAEAAKSDPAREQALEAFLRSMADPNMDPAEQDRFLREAQKLWDTYYGMVLEAMDTAEPAPAEPEKPETPEEPKPVEEPKPAEEPKPVEEPKPAEEPKEEKPQTENDPYHFNGWENFEDMFDDIMNGMITVDPNGTPTIGLPNPWTETRWLEEAEMVSGVNITLPEKQALPAGMVLSTLRAMNGTIEADYSDGQNELKIRASVIDEGYTLSGDYNNYSKEWKIDVGGVLVDCLGDGKTINVASYKLNDVAVALTMACGQEGQGLTESELMAIVLSLDAKAGRSGNQMDIYANPWGFFGGSFGPFGGMYGAFNQGDQADDDTGSGKSGTETRPGTGARPGPSYGNGGKHRAPGFYYGYIG